MYTVLTSHACVPNLHLVFHANLGCLGSEWRTPAFLPSFLLEVVLLHRFRSAPFLSFFKVIIDIKRCRCQAQNVHVFEHVHSCFLCNFSSGLGCFVF